MNSKKYKTTKEEYIIVALYAIIALLILFICRVEIHTSDRICSDWGARRFLDQIARIPHYRTERHVLAWICFLIQCLITAFRKRIADIPLVFRYLISVVYLGACIIMMFCINDIQSVLVLSFLICLMTFFKDTHRWLWVFMLIAVFILLASDLFDSLFVRFSFSDYIDYYPQRTSLLLFGVHSLLTSLTVVAIVGYFIITLSMTTSESVIISNMNELLTKTANELRKSNEALQEYSQKVETLSKNQERNRIAREIHDTLGHTLTGIASSVEVCQELTGDENETVQKYLRASREMALNGLEDVRRSINELRPDLVENSDLNTALKTMTERFSDAQKVKISFENTETATVFSDDEKEAIFRIVQESMTNAVRHGHCNSIDVRLTSENDTAIVTITDNGVGCAEIVPGFGIHHMRERVDMLGGNIELSPAEPHGLQVRAAIPIRRISVYDTSIDS